jgi:hypothetical protein
LAVIDQAHRALEGIGREDAPALAALKSWIDGLRTIQWAAQTEARVRPPRW